MLHFSVNSAQTTKKKPIVSITDDINVMTETNVHWEISVTLKTNINVYTKKKILMPDYD